MVIKKKILVIDWLDTYGGSEKVVKYLHELYDFDKVYTLVNVMSESSLNEIFAQKKIEIKTSFLQSLGKHFRYGLPLFPMALKKINITEENALVISISHSVVKGIQYPKSSQHFSYLVARNLKYVWEEKPLYFRGFKKIFSFIIPSLRRYDIAMSERPTKIISVSNFVSDWATKKYNREITTINPPVSINDFEYQEEKKEFYVTVGRLEPYKRFDILIDVFNKNGKELIIIGDGTLKKELENKAHENIKFKGYLFPEKSKEYLKNAKAFVFCGKEDFGIALLEPQVCGTPVIAYGSGGALDSVIENKTGLFFENQTAESLSNKIIEFEKLEFRNKDIREHAEKFSIENFKKEFKFYLDQEINKK